MSWEAEYSRKLQTAYDALRYVESGMRVYIQPGCAEPETLVEALIQRAPFVRNVEIVHMMTMGCAPYVAPDMAGHFRHNAVFIGSNVREAINDGRADYTPIYLSEIEELFERQFPPSGTGRGAVEESSLPHSQNEMSQLRPTDTSFPKHALPSGKLPLARPCALYLSAQKTHRRIIPSVFPLHYPTSALQLDRDKQCALPERSLGCDSLRGSCGEC